MQPKFLHITNEGSNVHRVTKLCEEMCTDALAYDLEFE